MAFLITEKERKLITEARAEKTGRVSEMWDILSEKVYHNRMRSVFETEDDTDWWRCVSGLSDAGFIHCMEPDEELGRWIKENVMSVIRKPLDEWIGPWFRTRTTPPKGTLETSHICVAIVNAVDMNESLFTQEEMQEIKAALREKGLLLCKNWMVKSYPASSHINNWFVVLLTGIAAVCAFLDEKEEFGKILEMYDYATQLFNKDSYGESLGYWGYAAAHMVKIREYVRRYKEKLGEKMDTASYSGSISWAVSSYLYSKKLEGWEDSEYPLCLNFGDSAYIRRMHASLLLNIAVTEKERAPEIAGMARWLFEEQYREHMLVFKDVELGNTESLDFWSLLYYVNASEPVSPIEAKLPRAMSFEAGNVIIRDSWQDTGTILGIQGGYEQLCSSSHRHEDLNSFILTHKQEPFFIDPGHCCYRLEQSKIARETKSHNTWQFEVDGQLLGQKPASGCFVDFHEPLCKKLDFVTEDGMVKYSSDAAGAYGAIARKAIRTYIMVSANLVLIRDDVETNEDIRLNTNFHINNSDNALRYDVDILENAVTLYRKQVGVKLQQIWCRADGEESNQQLSNTWGIMHLNYHLMPNHKCQGTEGSTVIYNYKSVAPARTYTNVYAIIMDEADKLGSWHIEKKGDTTQILNGEQQFEIFSDLLTTSVK